MTWCKYQFMHPNDFPEHKRTAHAPAGPSGAPRRDRNDPATPGTMRIRHVRKYGILDWQPRKSQTTIRGLAPEHQPLKPFVNQGTPSHKRGVQRQESHCRYIWAYEENIWRMWDYVEVVAPNEVLRSAPAKGTGKGCQPARPGEDPFYDWNNYTPYPNSRFKDGHTGVAWFWTPATGRS